LDSCGRIGPRGLFKGVDGGGAAGDLVLIDCLGGD